MGLALHAGVEACGPPRVPVYHADTLNDQLDAAAARVVGHFLARDAATAWLPPICRYYPEDFRAADGAFRPGPVAAAVAQLAAGSGPGRELARRLQRGAKVKAADFDCAPVGLRRLVPVRSE